MKKLITLIAAVGLFTQNSHAVLHSVGLDKSLYTSDFMIGKVAVAIIFVESNGSFDPSTENWSEDRKSLAVSKIMSGLNWWTKQNTRSPLSFTYVTETVTTKYEPVTRPYYDESLWIPEVMGKLGFSGTRFTATRNYVNDMRSKYKTDWGFVIFMCDSLNDIDGKFSNGLFAYSYLGGPFMVMTYTNDGYGIGNMDVVVAHEAGHIFNALDQYAGASSPSDYTNGYFPTINGNHAYSTIANEPNSIMRGGIRWGLDEWTKQAVGWRDNNKNGQDDILDQSPNVSIKTQTTSSSGSNVYTGEAKVTVLARQGNASGNGLTTDTIAKVEYKLSNGEWTEASPVGGSFDNPTVSFQITLPGTSGASAVKAQDINLRAITQSSLTSGGGGSSSTGGGFTAASINDAHAFPNPFKPNSSLGHTAITFTGLVPGTKVQVFSTAGDAVFEKTAPDSMTTLEWLGVNKDGKDVSTGVYYYLLTDPSGGKKKGKVAVIR